MMEGSHLPAPNYNPSRIMRTFKFRSPDGAGRWRQWLFQPLRLGMALNVFGVAGVMACNDVTEPAQEVNTISLSTNSVMLPAGTSQLVVLTVSAQSPRLRLTLSGVPSGVTASFSPEIISQGLAQSALTLVASSSAVPGEATVTVAAAPDGAPASGTAGRATATLQVKLTGCPGYAIPSNCPPFPTGGTGVITGVVAERSEAGNRPAAIVPVWAWVQFPTYGYSAGRVNTDANGRYQFPNLPHTLVLLQTGGNGYDQPCASSVQLSAAGATVNLEIVAQAKPIVDPSPAPPALVGVVYETTPAGRQPVPDARIYYETRSEVVAATTTTDERGRYSLCRLPDFEESGYVTPVKPGYVITGRSVTVSGVVELDMEVKKQ